MASESESSSEPNEEEMIEEQDDDEQVDSFERMDVLALAIRA